MYLNQLNLFLCKDSNIQILCFIIKMYNDIDKLNFLKNLGFDAININCIVLFF